MILKLDKNHQAMELDKVCINHDPGMTLTYFTAMQKIVKILLKQNTSRKWANG